MTPDEIREARDRLGLSQVRLAERLPVSRRTLEDWEAGRRNPPDYLVRAIRDLERELTEYPRT
jgi:DNA-binding transcriptional regulator YiaG